MNAAATSGGPNPRAPKIGMAIAGQALTASWNTRGEKQLAGKPLHKLPVAFEALRVPTTRGAKKVRASLEDASVAEIRAATRALDRDKRGRVPEEAKALVAAPCAAKLPEVSVRVQSGKVWIGEFPLESVAALGKALAKLRLGWSSQRCRSSGNVG